MTGTQARPTIKRRRIGALLRQYREAHTPKILSKTAARHIGVEPSQLGRMERGEYRVKPAQIEDLLDLYGIDDHNVFMELRRAALEPVDAGWWYPYRRWLNDAFLDFITLENEATEILFVSAAGIAGLVQSMAYAREIQETDPIASIRENADMYVQVRLSRQQAIVRSKNPAKFRCIIPEAALHSSSPSIPDQITHLLSLAAQDNVSIQVMPMDVPAGQQIDVQCSLLKFPEPWTPVMYSSVLGGGVLRDDEHTIRAAEDRFAALEHSALPVDKTREFLEERLRKVRNDH
jgi:hypothetical protein